MNALDSAVMGWLNGFARLSADFDRAVCLVAFNDLLKGAFTVTLFWWIWFARPQAPDARTRRTVLAATMLTVLAALAVNRALASLLPFRIRPVNDPGSGFVAPAGLRLQPFNDLSSFPSDHAVMFLGFALGLSFVSKPTGVLAFIHALVIALLPRLYLGLHWPTDVLAGAILGMGAVWTLAGTHLRDRIAAPLLRWSEVHPASFFAAAFLLSFGFATLFDPAVTIAQFLTGPRGG